MIFLVASIYAFIVIYIKGPAPGHFSTKHRCTFEFLKIGSKWIHGGLLKVSFFKEMTFPTFLVVYMISAETYQSRKE